MITISWPKRAVTVAVVWLFAWFLTGLGPQAPSPLILGGIVVAVFMLLWLWTDSFRVTDPVSWTPPAATYVGQRGVDHRVQRTAALLASGRHHANVAAEVHSTLVGVVDDLLINKYGVARTTDPALARTILGDRLWDFVSRPSRHRLSGYRAYLGDLLTDIETL